MYKLFLSLFMVTIYSCSTPQLPLSYMNRGVASIKQKRNVEQGFDLQAMSVLLNNVYGIEKFPKTIGKSQKIIFDNHKISEILSEHSQLIQSKLFGKELIEVKYCLTPDNDQGVMTAFYADSLICLNQKGMAGKSDELLKFFITHEIAHFIHEISTQDSSPYSRSLNGHLSAYQGSSEFDENVKKIVGALDHALTEKEQQELDNYIKEYTESAAQAHAEVDTYAYLIYTKLQLEIPTSALEQFFQTWINEGIEDAPKRLKGLKKYLH